MKVQKTEPLPETLANLPWAGDADVAEALRIIHSVYPLTDTPVDDIVTCGSPNPQKYLEALYYFIESASRWWDEYDAYSKAGISTANFSLGSSIHARLDHQQALHNLQREHAHLISHLANFLGINASRTFRDMEGRLVATGPHTDAQRPSQMASHLFDAVGKAKGCEMMPVLGAGLGG